jgi:IS5 family transposase
LQASGFAGGYDLRIAGTVVATHIPHPTDRTLLSEGVRVLSRPLVHAKSVGPKAATLARDAWRDRTRSAKRPLQRLREAARQRGPAAADRLHPAYQPWLDLAQVTVQPAPQGGRVRDAPAPPRGKHLAAPLTHLVPLVCQVIPQTTRRVLQGEGVPAAETVVRRFAPHTAIIRPGNPGKPTEGGRVLWWDAVEGGIISRYAVLAGNPAEDAHLPRSLDHHRRGLRRPPRLLAGDRGGHATAHERYAATHGVQQVVWPKPGATSAQRLAYEPQRGLRRGHNWRAGIAGRISGLKRRHKLEQCRYHGTDGMERGGGWGVIVYDLRVIARATAR